MPNFKKISPQGAELFHADVQTDRNAWRCWQSLCAIFRTHLNTQLYVLISRFQSMYNFPLLVCVQSVPDACYRQLPQSGRLLPSVAPALCWTQQKHISAIGPGKSQRTHDVWTHCWQRTVPCRNICAHQGHSSTAVVPAGIFGGSWKFCTANCRDA